MKSKTSLTILGTLIVIAGLFAWGYANSDKSPALVQGASHSVPPGTASSTTQTAGALSAAETFYDFGAISMKNGDVAKEFIVTNSSAGDIEIGSLETSCMCTNAFFVLPDGKTKGPFGMAGMGYVPPVNETLKAGESAVVRVVYDPNAHGPAGVGSIDRFVMLKDSKGDELDFEIKAVVTP